MKWKCEACLDEGVPPCILTYEDESLEGPIEKPELCPFTEENKADWVREE